MFQKIAAAIAFWPRMKAILSEASRLSQPFNAELTLVHAGGKDEHKKKLLVVAATGQDLNILDSMFPQDLEHIPADLPCNLGWVQAD